MRRSLTPPHKGSNKQKKWLKLAFSGTVMGSKIPRLSKTITRMLSKLKIKKTIALFVLFRQMKFRSN